MLWKAVLAEKHSRSSIGLCPENLMPKQAFKKGQDAFHAEKDAVYEAGLRSSPWQHIDETSARVNGQNQHCHIVCNPLYSAYFTTEKKDRLTVIDVLSNADERYFILNDGAFEMLPSLRVSGRVIERLHALPQQQALNESEFTRLLDQHLPDLGLQQHKRVLDAAAIAAYHAQTGFPVAKLLSADVSLDCLGWLTHNDF